MPPPPSLSIIIPVLNDSAPLADLLHDLSLQANIKFEAIVADGGSVDSVEKVAAAAGALYICSGSGRGRQMNAGATIAAGRYLLFLHADSRLTDQNLLANAIAAISERISSDGSDIIAGHFPLRFIRSGRLNETAYRYAEGKSAFNRKNTINGDQGMLLSRALFDILGGFDETLPFLEDQQIAERIRCIGRWITLPGFVHTSARRFETEGFHRRYILMSIMMGFYSTGVVDFFRKTPGVYRVQQDTGRLLLYPFFQVIWGMIRHDWGINGTVAVFFRLGGYIRENIWQLFYFIDNLPTERCKSRRYPLLAFHDNYLHRIFNCRLLDAIAGIICFIWFMLLLCPFFGITEAIDRMTGRTLSDAKGAHNA